MIEQDENAELAISFAEDWAAYFFANARSHDDGCEILRTLIFATFAAGGVMSEHGMTMDENQLFLDRFASRILQGPVR